MYLCLWVTTVMPWNSSSIPACSISPNLPILRLSCLGCLLATRASLALSSSQPGAPATALTASSLAVPSAISLAMMSGAPALFQPAFSV